VRRRLGLILCFVGGSLLFVAGGRYALGAVRADNARQAWNQARASQAAALARSAVFYGETAKLVGGAPVARLVIPRIGLDEIVLQGVDDDELDALPGHLPGSVLPGESGNSVISAHRDRHFSRLDEVGVGDTVITETGTRRNVWVIVSRQIVGKDDPALFQTAQPTLTLTTCWPIRYVGPAPERLILTAKTAD
jgi:sortase A